MCFAPQQRTLFRHLDVKKWSENVVFLLFWLGHVLRATMVCTFSTAELPKSGPNMVCFVHFDLEMCFAPQRRALSRHLNFQEWSETVVFWHCWLGNVLRAITACTFSSLLWPAGSAPAALARLLFDPPEPQIIGKTQYIATFLPFRAPAASLFWLSPSLLFSLLGTLHTFVFPSLRIVGSLTSKLPSPISYIVYFWSGFVFFDPDFFLIRKKTIPTISVYIYIYIYINICTYIWYIMICISLHTYCVSHWFSLYWFEDLGNDHLYNLYIVSIYNFHLSCHRSIHLSIYRYGQCICGLSSNRKWEWIQQLEIDHQSTRKEPQGKLLGYSSWAPVDRWKVTVASCRFWEYPDSAWSWS